MSATFDSAAKKTHKVHTVYEVDGIRVPGVTTVVGILDKPALVHWAWNLGREGVKLNEYRDALADVGTLAHAMAVAYCMGKRIPDEVPGVESYAPDKVTAAMGCATHFIEWADKSGFRMEWAERKLTSRINMFGGQPDLYGTLDGRKVLVDLKTAKAVYAEMKNQVAAYLMLLTENGIPWEAAYILRIGRTDVEGYEPELRPVDHIEDRQKLFMLCRQIYSMKHVTGEPK